MGIIERLNGARQSRLVRKEKSGEFRELWDEYSQLRQETGKPLEQVLSEDQIKDLWDRAGELERLGVKPGKMYRIVRDLYFDTYS